MIAAMSSGDFTMVSRIGEQDSDLLAVVMQIKKDTDGHQ